jgi:hypothetical protein
VLVVGLFALGTAGPAGADKIYTIDGNNDNVNQPGGTDDVTFSFTGSTGLVSGSIRAVDLSGGYSGNFHDDLVATYVDFTGNPDYSTVDVTIMDVLIVDITLDTGSALIDEIRFGVGGTDPLGANPIGAGFLEGCDPFIPVGCAYNVPGGGETPYETDDIFLVAGIPNVFPGAVRFEYDKLVASSENLQADEITRRLFITYLDLDGNPQAPLSKIGQVAKFLFSSGTDSDPIYVDIVPEPGTGFLVGLGLTMLTWVGRSRAH